MSDIAITVTDKELTALLDGLHLEIEGTRDAVVGNQMRREWREEMLEMMEALEDRLSREL